jgi:hypothetical protein
MSMYMLAQKNKDVSSETQCRMDIGSVTGATLLRQISFITLYVDMHIYIYVCVCVMIQICVSLYRDYEY